MAEYKPLNQEDPENRDYNLKGGVAVVQGSKLAQEMQKWEQFPSKWGDKPGNPYTGPKEFPMMIYKAQEINGKPFVQMPEPISYNFRTRDEYKAALHHKEAFDKGCQRIVNDETELSRAIEAGWRPGPQEAVEFALARQEKLSRAAAEREYADSKMSPKAQAEAKAAKEAVGNEHLGEIERKPVRRRKVVTTDAPKRRGRPKGSKNKPKPAA